MRCGNRCVFIAEDSEAMVDVLACRALSLDHQTFLDPEQPARVKTACVAVKADGYESM